MGAMELLMVALLAGGNALPDAVSFVPPRDYFQVREIQVSAEALIELAAKEPKDAKTQVQQLLALRQLDEDAAELKKAPKYADYRRTLEQIAAGAKAQDPQGFAKEYAQRLLARLDGKKPPAVESMPARKALDWFPANANLIYITDLTGGGKGSGIGLPLDALFKMIPPQAKNELYGALEEIGNVRVQRIALATAPGEMDKKNPRHEIFIRITGKANPDWIAALAKNKGGLVAEPKKGPAGESLIYLREPEAQPGGQFRRPALALLDDRDLLIAGYDGPLGGPNDKSLEKLFAVRDGRQPGITKGPLQPRLQKISPKAVGLLVADLPPEWNEGFPGGVQVSKIDAAMVPDQGGLDVHAAVTLSNPQQAATAVQGVSQARKQAIDALKQVQDMPPFPGLPIVALINALETVQVQQQDEQMLIRLVVPAELMRGLPTMMLAMPVRMQAAPAPPQAVPAPPPPKKEEAPKKR
jgi:hypothetical protein